MKLAQRANRYLTEDDGVTDVDFDGQDDKIEIYYASLDNDTQKKVMDALKKALNVSDTDAYSVTKIEEALTKTPIYTILGSELSRQLQIKI